MLRSMRKRLWIATNSAHVIHLPLFTMHLKSENDRRDILYQGLFHIILRPGHDIMIDTVMPEKYYNRTNNSISVKGDLFTAESRYKYLAISIVGINFMPTVVGNMLVTSVVYQNKPLMYWDSNAPLDMLLRQWDTLDDCIAVHRYSEKQYYGEEDSICKGIPICGYFDKRDFDCIIINDPHVYMKHGFIAYYGHDLGGKKVLYAGCDDEKIDHETVPDYRIKQVYMGDYDQCIYRYNGINGQNWDGIITGKADDFIDPVNGRITGDFFSFTNYRNTPTTIFYANYSGEDIHMTADGYITAYTYRMI